MTRRILNLPQQRTHRGKMSLNRPTILPTMKRRTRRKQFPKSKTLQQKTRQHQPLLVMSLNLQQMPRPGTTLFRTANLKQPLGKKGRRKLQRKKHPAKALPRNMLLSSLLATALLRQMQWKLQQRQNLLHKQPPKIHRKSLQPPQNRYLEKMQSQCPSKVIQRRPLSKNQQRQPKRCQRKRQCPKSLLRKIIHPLRMKELRIRQSHPKSLHLLNQQRRKPQLAVKQTLGLLVRKPLQ
jgi:hypothetical protein